MRGRDAIPLDFTSAVPAPSTAKVVRDGGSSMHHLHFNHLAILVAALYQWILGALWYSLFFAKPWMALTGHQKGAQPKRAVIGMVSSFIGGLILSLMLAHVVIWSGTTSIGHGAFIGFICWLGFIAVPLFAETIYEQRPFKLLAINLGYWLAALLVSGALLAVWQ
ncbi:MAG: DUF1761 domain-containing protein [Terracidiphilus sp.]